MRKQTSLVGAGATNPQDQNQRAKSNYLQEFLRKSKRRKTTVLGYQSLLQEEIGSFPLQVNVLRHMSHSRPMRKHFLCLKSSTKSIIIIPDCSTLSPKYRLWKTLGHFQLEAFLSQRSQERKHGRSVFYDMSDSEGGEKKASWTRSWRFKKHKGLSIKLSKKGIGVSLPSTDSKRFPFLWSTVCSWHFSLSILFLCLDNHGLEGRSLESKRCDIIWIAHKNV